MIEPLPASPDGLVWGFALGITKVLDEQRDASNELVTHASDLLCNAGWKVHMFIAEGDPKSVILDEARAWNADLIVVGSHGRKGWAVSFSGVSRRPLHATLPAQ